MHWTNHGNSLGHYSGVVLQDPGTGALCAAEKVPSAAGGGLDPSLSPVNITCAMGPTAMAGPHAWDHWTGAMFYPHRPTNDSAHGIPYDVCGWRESDGMWYVGL